MDPLIFSDKFTVKAHDVNRNGCITIPALMKQMQEVSLQHARKLKTSVWDMVEERLTWVLIRKEIKILEPPKMDQTYSVLTYPSGFAKFFALRDYLIFNKDKKLVVGASSTWTLMETVDRKLMKIPPKILEIGVPADTRFLPQPKKRIDFTAALEKVDERRIRPYDLDWNHHVNNIILLRFMTEALKQKQIEDDQISKILVHFKNELKLDQIAEVMQSEGSGEYLTRLVEKESQKEIAVSKIDLREKEA